MAILGKDILVETRKVTALLYTLKGPVCMCEGLEDQLWMPHAKNTDRLRRIQAKEQRRTENKMDGMVINLQRAGPSDSGLPQHVNVSNKWFAVDYTMRIS